MYDLKLLKRMVKDIRMLLGLPEPDETTQNADHVGLWDDRAGEVPLENPMWMMNGMAKNGSGCVDGVPGGLAR